MTLVELMVSLVISAFIIAGAMAVVVTQVQMNSRSFQRTDIQRAGRVAMAKIAQKIELAGLGLPSYPGPNHTGRSLAFQEYRAAGLKCASTPDLVVTSLDLSREWQVSSVTGGGTSSGTITLLSANPDPYRTNSGTNNDGQISVGSWVFVYQSTRYSATPTTGQNGYGMVQVAQRNLGATSFTATATNFQPGTALLDLSQIVDTTSTRAPAVLVADVVRIGVDCTSVAGHAYLYMQTADQTGQALLVSNVDITPLASDNPAIVAKANDVVGLRFRFLVDQDGDGLPDDQNGDGVKDLNDWLPGNSAKLTWPADFSAVVGVEVLIQIKSDKPVPRITTKNGVTTTDSVYQTMDFIDQIWTPNINTQTGSTYLFIDNLAL